MTNTQHTPGPWRVGTAYAGGTIPVLGYGDTEVATLSYQSAPNMYTYYAGKDAQQANAQLIAQAPTLKAENEALRAALKQINGIVLTSSPTCGMTIDNVNRINTIVLDALNKGGQD